MSEKKGVQLSGNEEKLKSLRSQFEEVIRQRETLQSELNTITTLAIKLQGAIEVLEGMVEESKQKKEEKSD
jgi:prefoldin subunit 5